MGISYGNSEVGISQEDYEDSISSKDDKFGVSFEGCEVLRAF